MKVRRSVAKVERAFTKVAKPAGSEKEAGLSELKPRMARVGVAKGFGPMHAENAMEGDVVDPAMLPKLPGYAQGTGNAEFSEEELKQVPNWLRDIMRSMPQKAPGSRGPQVDPRAVPIVPGSPAGQLMYDPTLSANEDQVALAAKGKSVVQYNRGSRPNTDTVPAMLTPREAVLNRNAAELAGRGRIEKLNAEGNKLAKKGVDLAAGGDNDVSDPRMNPDALGMYINMKMPHSKFAEYPDEPLSAQEKLEMAAKLTGLTGADLADYQMRTKGTSDMKPKHKTGSHSMPAMPPGLGQLLGSLGGPAAAGPQQQMPPPRGGFYPPGQGFASGTEDIASLGSGGGAAYGAPVQLSSPDILKYLQAIGQKQGLSASQIAGLAQAFKGLGQGGGGAAPTDVSGGYYGLSQSPGAYQGGISDIGYPPFVAPSAEYHADKGSNWNGPYDPAYMINRYARGTASVWNGNHGFFR